MEKIKFENSNGKDISSITLQRIGNFIKEARTNRNQSINELASDLKISVQQLKAIEEGKVDLLPEIIFVKAMVKRISEKLKLDTNFIMGEFNNKNEEIKIEELSEEVEKTPIKLPVGFFITIIISGMVGLFTSSYIFNILSDMKFESNKTNIIIKN